MLDPFTIGILLVFLVVGAGAFMLIAGLTPSTFGIGKTLGLSSVAGFFGSGLSMYSDTWNYLVSCVYGALGFYGWLFVFGLLALVGVWIWNGIQDISKNRPIGIVD
ncbi:MAG: hypothetical protein DRP30_04565 [Thermotoga sp.]|nr:MAG: hypothetical protein DRP30_04565 [Thermotoga sp.]